jgi:hypothetical protein
LESYDDGKIILRNIAIPNLIADQKTILLNLFGDMILHIDSSEILLDSVVFIDVLNEAPELNNGYITLFCCEEGGTRLLQAGNIPGIKIKNNPASSTLETEIKVLEVGNYTLEIIDILGNSEFIKK